MRAAIFRVIGRWRPVRQLQLDHARRTEREETDACSSVDAASADTLLASRATWAGTSLAPIGAQEER